MTTTPPRRRSWPSCRRSADACRRRGRLHVQRLSAFVAWTPAIQQGRVPADLAGDARVAGLAEVAGVARVLGHQRLLAPLLLALKGAGLLPFGSATFLFVAVATSMCALSQFALGGAILAAAAAASPPTC